MTLPAVNAQLTQVAGTGFAEDLGGDEGADTVRWSGNIGVYVTEKVEQIPIGQRLDLIKVTRLTVPSDVGALAQNGDTVTYAESTGTRVRKVRNIENHSLIGTFRLFLQPE